VRSAAQGIDGRQALYQGVPEKSSEIWVYGRRIIASLTGRHMSNFFFAYFGQLSLDSVHCGKEAERHPLVRQVLPTTCTWVTVSWDVVIVAGT
jgi:hypothetical protein